MVITSGRALAACSYPAARGPARRPGSAAGRAARARTVRRSWAPAASPARSGPRPRRPRLRRPQRRRAQPGRAPAGQQHGLAAEPRPQQPSADSRPAVSLGRGGLGLAGAGQRDVGRGGLGLPMSAHLRCHRPAAVAARPGIRAGPAARSQASGTVSGTAASGRRGVRRRGRLPLPSSRRTFPACPATASAARRGRRAGCGWARCHWLGVGCASTQAAGPGPAASCGPAWPAALAAAARRAARPAGPGSCRPPSAPGRCRRKRPAAPGRGTSLMRQLTCGKGIVIVLLGYVAAAPGAARSPPRPWPACCRGPRQAT